MTQAWTEFFATRMDGAGNNFFILDERKTPLAVADRTQFVSNLCQGISDQTTDGVVFLKDDAELDFAWDFYNGDGSIAELCGNAARCASLYVFAEKEELKQLTFRTLAGPVTARRTGPNSIEVQLPTETILDPEMRVKIGSEEIEGFYVNTGVPHFVLIGEAENELGETLRKAKEFHPQGTNVTFLTVLPDMKSVEAITYERGVEGFTMACGTGAVAAAAYLKHINPRNVVAGITPTYNVEMPGGNLRVRWLQGVPFLEGAAHFHYRAQLSQEIL